LFLDEINQHNPTPLLGTIEATNPCGEQPLLPFESCTLGSLNLAAFVSEGMVDWQRLATAVNDATVFLDNVIEANHYPFPEIESATRRTRKIGLGVMGLAELFARLGMAYDSQAAVALAGQIARIVNLEARRASVKLAERRGSFPAFHQSAWPQRALAALRNATLSCVAPTGTISVIAGTSSSIEPFFALALQRSVLDGLRQIEFNSLAKAELEALGKVGSDALREIREHGSLRKLTYVPEPLRRRFPIALEIAPEWHLRMQAAFQAHVDAAVSKTVNLPSDTPPETVRGLFFLARRLKLKGITVYRYGCRAGQTLSLVDEKAQLDCRECAV
jgi:ribonucleoside-diphosphate reductase alpha chain